MKSDNESFSEEKKLTCNAYELGFSNRSRNSLGVMMRMFSNGLSISRSGSLVMIQSALPLRARSRYLSSSGSLQAFTCLVMLTLSPRSSYSSRNSFLISNRIYRSNFGRVITSIVSAKTGFEMRSIEEVDSAFSSARPEKEESSNKALTKMLQSKTSRIYSLLSSSSKISGVSPFLRACSLASCIMSDKLLRLDKIRSTASEIVFFSAGVIRATLSAAGSLTSRVIVFI